MARRLSEAEGYALLAKYGIRVPKHEVAASRADAGAIAERIGYPVVLKVVSPDIVHKSSVGGVITRRYRVGKRPRQLGRHLLIGSHG